MRFFSRCSTISIQFHLLRSDSSGEMSFAISTDLVFLRRIAARTVMLSVSDRIRTGCPDCPSSM